MLGALFVALTICWRFGARLSIVADQRENHQLRVEVVERVLDPRGQRTGLRAGEIMQIATSDAERAMNAMHAVAFAAAACTALAVSAVSLLTINLPLGLAVLIGVPVLVAGLQVLSPLLTRRATAAQEAAGSTTALATDLVRGVRALRGIGAMDSAATAYRTSSTHGTAREPARRHDQRRLPGHHGRGERPVPRRGRRVRRLARARRARSASAS